MKARLLVIDDTPSNIHVLLEGLKDLYSITAATRGDRGLELARAQPPDLILLDVVMDGMDGYEVLAALREDVRTAGIPVVFVTAQTDAKDEERGLALGAVDYITKPFRISVVRARIQNHLELKSHRDRLEHMVQEQVRETINSHITTIFAMSKLAESRDDETGTHLERTRQYCRLLARRLQATGGYPDLVDEDFIHRIFQASPLHDIGKVAIPDGILKKPGKLTQEEFEVMKTHTLRGAETLASVTENHPHNEFIQFGLQIARSHHEKWDGSGYPDRLRGSQIPLAARIMAVADVYDALTSKRCYKDAMSHQEAREIIRSQSGFHFEPLLVETFLAIEEEFAEILSGYRGDE